MTSGLLTRTLRVIGVAAFCLTSAMPSASADPVSVTSGQFSMVWSRQTAFLFFGTDGFVLNSIVVQTSSSPALSCNKVGCPAGTALDLSTVAGPDLGLVGWAVVEGTEFVSPFPPLDERPRLTGTFSFDAPTIVLPPIDIDVVGWAVDFTAPFVFNGFVTAFAPDDVTGTAPLFSVALTGRGTVNLELEVFPQDYSSASVRYVFESDVAPVPEPATMGLFGTGLIGLAARSWRRKRTGEKPGQV